MQKIHIYVTFVCTCQSAVWVSRPFSTVVSRLLKTRKPPRTELKYRRLENNKGKGRTDKF